MEPPFSRDGDAARLGHGDEVPDVSQFHYESCLRGMPVRHDTHLSKSFSNPVRVPRVQVLCPVCAVVAVGEPPDRHTPYVISRRSLVMTSPVGLVTADRTGIVRATALASATT